MNSTDYPLLQGIDTVIIRVSDIEVSRAWYQDKLGLAAVWEDPRLQLVVVYTGGPTSLTLWQTSAPVTVRKETAAYPIFRTPDAVALQRQLQENGVETGEVMEDAYTKSFSFFDPDGNVLEACQVLS